MLRSPAMLKWLTLLALPASLWASWAAWRGPPPPRTYSTPPSIERTISPQAKLAAIELGRELTLAIQAAAERHGHAIGAHELESVDQAGTPFIDRPIPDNPLMPGIASIDEVCPTANASSQADWVYCPQSGVIRPVLAGQSTSGNE